MSNVVLTVFLRVIAAIVLVLLLIIYVALVIPFGLVDLIWEFLFNGFRKGLTQYEKLIKKVGENIEHGI